MPKFKRSTPSAGASPAGKASAPKRHTSLAERRRRRLDRMEETARQISSDSALQSLMERNPAAVEAIVQCHSRDGGSAANKWNDLLAIIPSWPFFGWAVVALQGRTATFEVDGAMTTVPLVKDLEMADVRRSLEGSVKPPGAGFRAGTLFAARIALNAAFISTALKHKRPLKHMVRA
jgi:hypothetical protein